MRNTPHRAFTYNISSFPASDSSHAGKIFSRFTCILASRHNELFLSARKATKLRSPKRSAAQGDILVPVLFFIWHVDGRVVKKKGTRKHIPAPASALHLFPAKTGAAGRKSGYREAIYSFNCFIVPCRLCL